jgi:hypothetical protein
MPEVPLESEKRPQKSTEPKRTTTEVRGVAKVRAEISLRAGQIDSDHSLISISLGDSYGSGEGNPDIPAVYNNGAQPQGAQWIFENHSLLDAPAVWWDRQCHRSLVSWPVLATMWRALADRHQHTRYVLLDYACSGAELIDGIFAGQLNPPGGAVATEHRDGVFATVSDRSRYMNSVRRSQINAFFDDVCGASIRTTMAVKVPSSGETLLVEGCKNPLRKADELMLSIGGNDIGFGPLALGILVPEKAREGFLNKPALALFRHLMGAKSPEEVDARVEQFGPYYKGEIHLVANLLEVQASNVFVVAYPDPVGPDFHGCTSAEGRSRIRDSNLALGGTLPNVFPLSILPSFQNWGQHAGYGWTVQIDQAEVEKFKKTYAKIAEMQLTLSGDPTDANPVHVVPFVDTSEFSGRRICDEQPISDGPLLPYYFCSKGHDCELHPNWGPLSASSYIAFSDKKRMVNSLNESILGQRAFLPGRVSSDLIAESMKGTLHPSTAAHAAAAYQLVRAIKALTDERSSRGS